MQPLLPYRLTAACMTVPNCQDWGLTVLSLVGYGAIALPLGLATQFLQWQPMEQGFLPLALRVFVLPALLEEIGFRVLWLPRMTEMGSAPRHRLWTSVSLGLFVVYHPLNAKVLYPAAFTTFADPVFLILVFLLGLTCTGVYRLTQSLWPPVFIHWSVVVIWLGYLGGYDRLMGAA